MTSQLSPVFLLTCFVGTTLSQLIIPKRPLGYVYGDANNDAQIHLDVHVDPLCYDCKIAFPTLLNVAEHYGTSTLKLTLHVFPLSFYRQSYLIAIATEAIRNLSSVDTCYKWLGKIYRGKTTLLYNSATRNRTADDVIQRQVQIMTIYSLSDMAILPPIHTGSDIDIILPTQGGIVVLHTDIMLAKFTGELGLNKTDFLAAMESSEIERNVRTAWKYSCTRGVASTPTFFLNDVPLTAEPKWTLSNWRKLIDPLVGDILKQRQGHPNGSKPCRCSNGTTKCCEKMEGNKPKEGDRCHKNNRRKRGSGLKKMLRKVIGKMLMSKWDKE